MTLRASGTAEICFGPVPVFVKLYSVASEESVSLPQVHAGCGERLEQQYVCPADGAVVPRAATVKQYRRPDGTVTTLTKEEIKSAESDRVGTLEILECVPEDSVDPICLGKAMFVGPNEEHGIDGYSTFVDALAETRTAAVGVHYRPTRDQLVLIQRYRGRGLLLRELFYAGEMRAIEGIGLPQSERATLMAGAFEQWTDAIERCRQPALQSGAYRDGYPDRLLRVAERTADAGDAVTSGGATSLLKAARDRAARGRAKSAEGERRAARSQPAGGVVEATGEGSETSS